MKLSKWVALSFVGTAMVLVAGCQGYATKDELNSQISELRSGQANLQKQVDANTAAIAQLKSELESNLKKYGAEISQLQGRLKVRMLTHFAFNKATLTDHDKAALDAFASVMNKYHPGALVTVEGFCDAAGTIAYNERLGMKRANAVRNYLVHQDGMQASRVRAVSYGKARDRQVIPGGWGRNGQPNRRATLVIDQVG